MSHVVDVKTNILDIDCFIAAAESLGLEKRDKQTFRWFGRHVGDFPLPEGFSVDDMGKCEFALGIKGNNTAYEVGVVRRRNGDGWTLLYDQWAGGKGMTKQIGGGCEKLLQAYAVEKVRRVAGRTHRVTRQNMPNGSIKLTLTR